MPTTNLHLAKSATGQPVSEAELKVGLKVTFPSGLGGVLDFRCVSVSAEKATFKSLNKDWPCETVCEFNAQPFSADDFDKLDTAMNAFNCWNTQPTDAMRAMVRRAHLLGHVHQRSFTQAHWTERGIKAAREASSVNAAEMSGNDGCLSFANTR